MGAISFPRYTVLPWLKGPRTRARAEHARVHARWRSIAFRLARHRMPLAQRLHEWISAPARWRLDHDFFAFPVELWLKDTRESLASGAEAQGGREATIG